MTQEEKDLLFKDLCSRIPYGVKIELTWWVMGEGTYINTTLEPNHIEQLLEDEDGDVEIKPYLFPLSSMSEEDIYQINDILGGDFEIDKHGITDLIRNRRTSLSYLELDALFSYFNKNHFDYHGLIEKGLAIDCTNLNIY